MDVTTIAFISAATALISAFAGPVVSYVIAHRQIRASVVTNSRERWTEALRDSLAEYVALLISASIVKEKIGDDPLQAVSANRDLLKIVKEIVQVKNKVLLMSNPDEKTYAELCDLVEATYATLVANDREVSARIRAGAEEITRVGRKVLRAQWIRIKRGE